MSSPHPLSIGNAQAFWGDDPDAPARLLAGRPDLDFLTLDYLAEVSLSILAAQRAKDPAAGFARDVLGVMDSALVPHWRAGGRCRVVTNAGGLDPLSAGRAVRERLLAAGFPDKRVAVVTGDDVLPALRAAPSSAYFRNAETRESAEGYVERFTTANAYAGAAAIAEAVRGGADVVLTGRVADPSLVVGPCLAHFGWQPDDWDRVAGATVAGHLIECGTQACGGFSTDWLDLPDPENIGFPVVEISADGSCVLTKPPGTGGAVNLRTTREQLLYEIGDPGRYLSPDATVSLLGLALEEPGPDRVRVSGAQGSPPPETLKVSATYRDGFRATATLTIYGRQAVAKARRCAAAVHRRLREAGHEPARWHVECLGTGAVCGGLGARVPEDQLIETVLRLSAADPERAPLEHFARLVAPLVTAGPGGVTGYGQARAKVQPVFGYWPCLVPRGAVEGEVRFAE